MDVGFIGFRVYRPQILRKGLWIRKPGPWHLDAGFGV